MAKVDKETAQKLAEKGLVDQSVVDSAFAAGADAQAVADNSNLSPQDSPIPQGYANLQQQQSAGQRASAQAELESAAAEDEIAEQPKQQQSQALLAADLARQIAEKYGLDVSAIPTEGQIKQAGTWNIEEVPEVELAADISREVPQDFPATGRKEIPGLTAPEMKTPGLDLIQQGIAAEAAAGAGRAAEQSAFYGNMAENMAEQRRALESFQEDRSAQIQAKEAELENEVNRVGSMSVDPNRYWANRTTADKIGMGISLVLGAFGSGSENRAAKVIRDAIEQDINLQLKDIATQKSLLGDKRGVLRDMKSTFRNDVMAKQAAIQSYLQQAQVKIKEIASRYAAPEARARATQLLGKLEQQKQAAKQKFMQEFMKRMPITANSNPELMTLEQRERFVPGYGLALTKSNAKKINEEEMPNYRSLDANIGRLLELSQKGSGFSLEDRAEAESIKQMMVGQMRLPILGPGTMQQFERDILEGMIPTPTDIFTLDNVNKRKLETIRQSLKRGFNDKMKSMGLYSTDDKVGFKPIGK